MVVPKDDAKIQRPGALLHIVMRDGAVIERDLVEDELKIGKGPQNDIILSDASVSGVHAMISFEDGVYKISDLGSRNGTLLNDVRIGAEPRAINHGDLIKMGHCALTFRLKDAGDTLSMPRTQFLGATSAPVPPPAPPTPKPAALTEDALAAALVSSGLVAQGEVERLRGQDARGRRLFRALIQEKLATEIGLRDLMSRTFNIPPVDLKTMDVDTSVATVMRPQFLRERLVCPVVMQPGQLALVVADPTDKATIDDVERVTRKKSSLRLATPVEIVAQLDRYFTPRLVGVMPSGEKIEAPLNQLETEIGKAPHNRVVISDPTVSHTHAIVLAREGGFNIADLGSSNGTFVNGRKLGNESHVLRHGDKIQLGQALLTFRNPTETVENKTAQLSLEALEEIRRRAMTRALSPTSQPPARTDPDSWGAPQFVQGVPFANGDDKSEKKKKKKDKDKNNWFSANALSRIVAQVLGALATGLVTIYLINTGMKSSEGNKNDKNDRGSGTSTASVVRNNAPWKDFDTSWLPFGKVVEASGVAFAPGSNGVLFFSDNSKSDAQWMQLDENGEKVGTITQIPLGINFKDPEAVTYGNAFFYMVTSQSDPSDGPGNTLVRFAISPETRTLRGQPEVITDFRSFLLQNVPTIATSGAPPGLQGGLNIEGIAWDPNNERLLLGLRSPQIGGQGGQAALVPLKLRDPGGPFTRENLKVDQPEVIGLTLDGQGVRDITYDSHLRSFLIISGAPETAPKTDFGLWEWDGQPNSKPIKLMTLEDKKKPEGVTSVKINGHDYAFIVGDAGGYLKLDYNK